MTTHEERLQAVPPGGDGPEDIPDLPARREVSQREADILLLAETLADCGAEERLVTRDELLDLFLERARLAPPVDAAQLERELEELPDPRFEGPDPETMAANIRRAKAMKDAYPGTSPDPEAPGIRKTRRLLSRRTLLTALLRPGEAAGEEAAPGVPAALEAPAQPAEPAEAVEPAPREVDRDYAAALLDELEQGNPDVASLTAWDGTRYYHFKPMMSAMYARILASGNNPAVQLADVVRESSRDYPRPVPVEMFEYPPFNFSPEALQQCLHSMAQDPDYEDILFTESSVGTVYLYSTRHLDAAYAAFLAENQDLGAIKSP